MLLRLALIVCLATFVPGCIIAAAVIVAAAVTVGTVSYVNNTASCDYGAPLDKVWEASIAAVAEAGFPPGTAKKDYQFGEIQTKAADGRQVVFTCKRVNDQSTHVDVRVGDFESSANRTSAEDLHAKLSKRLGAGKTENK
jgi:hypothetical protein